MSDNLFQSADRDTYPELTKEKEQVQDFPLIVKLMDQDPHFVAVLNKKRQCLMVNPLFLEKHQIQDSQEVLGLRPGELLHCANTEFNPLGCGTTDLCRYCSILSALEESISQDQTVQGSGEFLHRESGRQEALNFEMQIKPFLWKGESHYLLFLIG